MNPLTKLLQKFGVKSYLELNAEERKTYKEWETALVGRRLTDEDVKTFLISEKERATTLIVDPKTPKEVDSFYKMELNFIRKVEMFLNAPQVEQEMVVKQIDNLVV